MTSRRDLLRLASAGAAGGGAAWLAACGGSAERRRGEGLRGRGPDQDARILNDALDLEHTTVAAYAAAARLTRGGNRATVLRFGRQEREHVDALAGAIRELDAIPSPPKSDKDYSRAFPIMRSGRDALDFALDLESLAVITYRDSLAKLSDVDLRRTAAAIMTNEAQHISLLRSALGRPPALAAFVTGK